MLRDRIHKKNRAAKRGKNLRRQGKAMTKRQRPAELTLRRQAEPRPENRVVFTPPTEDEEKYLRTIELSSDEYDPSIVVGGPRNFRV